MKLAVFNDWEFKRFAEAEVGEFLPFDDGNGCLPVLNETGTPGYGFTIIHTEGGVNVDHTPAPQPNPIEVAEMWTESQGYNATRLLTCFTFLTNGKSGEKLRAVHAWTQTVIGMALAGAVEKLPPAPYTFEEVLAENSV